MKIRVTSIVASEVASIFRAVTVPLEDALNRALTSDSFGDSVDQVTIVAVAVDSDISENDKWSKPRNKVGSFKHLVTKERKKEIGLALSFDPMKVQKMSEEDLRLSLCKSLVKRLINPELEFPEGFDYEKFSSKMRMMLEIYGRATFSKH